MSALALIPDADREEGMHRLRADLDNGEWDRRWGHLLALDELDLGYRVVVAAPDRQPSAAQACTRERAQEQENLPRARGLGDDCTASDQDRLAAPSRSSTNQEARHGQDHLRRRDRGSVQGGP